MGLSDYRVEKRAVAACVSERPGIPDISDLIGGEDAVHHLIMILMRVTKNQVVDGVEVRSHGPQIGQHAIVYAPAKVVPAPRVIK
jgi:hypothetical protein